MKKAELVEAVAEKAGLTKADATRAIEALFDTVKTAMVKGERVAIPGFGTFSVGERAAREGRNPQTGATVKIINNHDNHLKSTVQNLVDLLKEFDSELMGIGVLIDNKLSTNKITKDYVSLIDIVEINEDGVKMVPPM